MPALAKILRARACEHSSNFCEQFKICEHFQIGWDHSIPLLYTLLKSVDPSSDVGGLGTRLSKDPGNEPPSFIFRGKRKLNRSFQNFATMSGSQLPMIFQTADLVFEDRVSAYKNDILGLCKPREVPERIAKYIAQNVDASGWQAVWRSTPKSSGQQQQQPFDVVVEVNDLIFSLLNRLKESYNQVLSIYYLS